MSSRESVGARQVANNFLFNFSASFLGGGYKRLHAYSRWFAEQGGASFIIHPHSAHLATEFSANRYFIEARPRHRRIINDWEYVLEIAGVTGDPDLYYSYGIPIYRKVGKLNWFHLSNVLPLGSMGIPMSFFNRLRVGFLGYQIRRHLGNADVVSGESLATLAAFPRSQEKKLFLSVNGSDDELEHFRSGASAPKDNIATVLGTYSYKALDDSLRVFEMLKASDGRLKLVIVGDKKFIPGVILRRDDVDARGLLSRAEVLGYLRRSRYYVSTTLVENSYNAAAEGMVFADESYISDIGPHRELLSSMSFDEVQIPGMAKQVLRVRREDVRVDNLKTWRVVIAEMLNHAAGKLQPVPQKHL